MWSYRLVENWGPLDLMTHRNEEPQGESRSVAFHQFPKNRKYTFSAQLPRVSLKSCLSVVLWRVLQLDWTAGPLWFRMKHICMILFDSKEDVAVSQHVSIIKGWKSICVFHCFFFPLEVWSAFQSCQYCFPTLTKIYHQEKFYSFDHED